jgi:hypothetical protein
VPSLLIVLIIELNLMPSLQIVLIIELNPCAVPSDESCLIAPPATLYRYDTDSPAYAFQSFKMLKSRSVISIQSPQREKMHSAK